jgi:hypothetical protein
MTRPAGARFPPFSSSSKYSPIQTFLPASYTADNLLDSVSSGPKRRKLVGFKAMTSRRNLAMFCMLEYFTAAGFSTGMAKLRKLGILSGFFRMPPLATGLALMRRLPVGQSALSSGLILPSANRRSGS